MKQLTFCCTKDGTEFQLRSGLTKMESSELQNQYPNDIYLQNKLIMDQQFIDFVATITEHSQQCDGQIVVDPTSYLIAD